MCGIAGWLGWVPDGEQIASNLLCLLRHRGPDGQSARHWPGAALVHTRLSIIDVSDAGAQPLGNEDQRVWTVFNGEIYNHRELRRDLEDRGHVFRGHSDTEVLPHLYEEYGPRFVARLRGMFALAIYDTKERTLLLARDRFGIKPLFYAPSSTRLAFASEIRALRRMPGIDERLNRQAIFDYAALRFIPAPETLFAGIRALEPGEILEARLDGEVVRWKASRYHRWSVAPESGMTIAEAVNGADELLTRAVHRQLQSDVPLGSLLSGGIDSSLVSAAAQTVNGGIRTFNARFSDQAYDETWAAKAVADHIGSRHETLAINEGEGSWEAVTGLLAHAGQPFADTSLFAVNAVCKSMRRHVTVALSGDGGDEAFGGYDVYWRIARLARLQRWPPSLWPLLASGVTPLARLGVIRPWLPQRLRDLSDPDNTALLQRLYAVPDAEHRSLCQDADLLPVRRLFERKWSWTHVLESDASRSRLETLSAHATEIDFRLVLPNAFLFKVDTASMKESLEVRVPMLDEDLVAFGLTLPHRLKVSGRTCKRVLRQVAARRLPASVARKPKMGFGIPVDVWVSQAFKARLRETLLRRSSDLSRIFRAETYRPWVESFCENRPYSGMSRDGLYRRVIMLLALDLALGSQD
jgi:asparagine synthase (glutamine-hydrolysing)